MPLDELRHYVSGDFATHATIARVLLSLCLFFLMINCDQRRLYAGLRQFRPILTGMLLNVLTLPIITFYVCSSSTDSPTTSSTLALIAITPSFIFPIYLARLANADVVLAFWVSFLSTFVFIGAFGVFVAAFSAGIPAIAQHLTPVSFPVQQAFVDAFACMFIPAAIGAFWGPYVRASSSNYALIARVATHVCVALVSALVIVVLSSTYGSFPTQSVETSVVPSLITFLVTVSAAYGGSLLVPQITMPQASAIALTASSRHISIAITLAVASLSDYSLAPATVLCWVAIQFPIGVIIAIAMRPLNRPQSAAISGTAAA